MIIKRSINGEDVAIELTPEELAEAYVEKEHLYDMENVRAHLESGCEDEFDEMSDEEFFQAVDEIAYLLRENLDDAYACDEDGSAMAAALRKWRNSH